MDKTNTLLSIAPNALPGPWRERGGLDGLVRLHITAVTRGLVVVAKQNEDWASMASLARRFGKRFLSFTCAHCSR